MVAVRPEIPLRGFVVGIAPADMRVARLKAPRRYVERLEDTILLDGGDLKGTNEV